MTRSVLVTAVTGHLGPHLVAELLAGGVFDEIVVAGRAASEPALKRLQRVEASARRILARRNLTASQGTRIVPAEMRLDVPGLGLGLETWQDLAARVDVIVHAAADTRFSGPPESLYVSNVAATRHICEFAGACHSLRQLLLVSTACVAGRTAGRVPERIAGDEDGFVNAYEQTKWLAEQIVVRSGLPARIARLTTCAGSHDTGEVHRFGTIHHLFHWIARGLVPMVPGAADTPVDIISTDIAAAWLARAAGRDPVSLDVCHVALGAEAIPLGELLDFVAAQTASTRAAAAARVPKPVLVDRRTFDLFQEMVATTGDALFARVQGSAGAMLPSLLFPKRYETDHAEACWGGAIPHPDWRVLLSKVIVFGTARNWGVGLPVEECHVADA